MIRHQVIQKYDVTESSFFSVTSAVAVLKTGVIEPAKFFKGTQMIMATPLSFFRQPSLAFSQTVILATFFFASFSAAQDVKRPRWIWGSPQRQTDQVFCMKTEFENPSRLKSARLTGLADFCFAKFYINGTEVESQEPYRERLLLDCLDQLQIGRNKVAVSCRSVDGPAALFVRLELEFADGSRRSIVSNENWQASELVNRSLELPSGQNSEWSRCHSFGDVARYPWDSPPDSIAIGAADDYTQWKRALQSKDGTQASMIQTLPGYKIQLIRSAQQGEDSWVSLVSDPKGRLIIGKEKRGLLRLTLSKDHRSTAKMEVINESLAECRGLVFSGETLYAMANNDKQLFRLQDTTGDDQYDSVVPLTELKGDVGHGRNQLTLGPGGRIYAIFGDSVFEPETAMALPPSIATPDRFESERSGFVARLNEAEDNWEIIVRGLRNPFGIDFNTDGEMFTYDADAEYDTGASWYRPTRIDHLLVGGDFGWRRVTKQWPPYFPDRPDMPQPVLDIGKGSPTAVKFGTHSRFPKKYQRALFALDWTYGRILAVHLDPRGATYAAQAETFIHGQPLNVTDVEFGIDGAMYFVTGGRSTQSALYRVAYVGNATEASKPTRQQTARQKHAQKSRTVRRRLENLLENDDPKSLEIAWPYLSSSDPSIRHIARVLLESQPIETWRDKATDEKDTNTLLAILLAVSRRGTVNDRNSP